MKAVDAFKKGHALLKMKDLANAKKAFKESLRLDVRCYDVRTFSFKFFNFTSSYCISNHS
jgi:hypothetical protein